MSLRDILFWIQSAKADATLTKFQQTHSLEASFDLLYSQVSDPYGASAPYYRYQRLKYDTLLSLLPAQRYRSVLDIGCGLGEFTRKIAPYADSVLGIDFSQSAITQARILSAQYDNVDFEQVDVLELGQAIDKKFDLVILADVLYYLSPSDEKLKSICGSIEDLLMPDGVLLLVNHFFFGHDRDSKITRQIHDAFRWSRFLQFSEQHQRPFYLVSILKKLPVPVKL